MTKFLIIIIISSLATVAGLYFRPSYTLIGQLDWWNVLTKGYFVGSFSKFFSQGLIDESFYYVMRYTGGGLVGGILLSLMMGKSKGSGSSSKKKK